METISINKNSVMSLNRGDSLLLTLNHKLLWFVCESSQIEGAKTTKQKRLEIEIDYDVLDSLDVDQVLLLLIENRKLYLRLSKINSVVTYRVKGGR